MITIFFPGNSKLKLMTFSIFFHCLTFATNICQRLRPIQNLGAFSQKKKFFFGKIHRKTPVEESNSCEITGLCPVISMRERTPTQVFSGKFCGILQTTFLQIIFSRLLLFYRKSILPTKQEGSSERRMERKKQLVRKTTTQTKQKLNHYLHQVFISFYYSRMSLFLFSLLPMIH